MIARRAALTLPLLGALAACPGPRAPSLPAGGITVEIGRPGRALAGVAGDGARLFAALTAHRPAGAAPLPPATIVEAVGPRGEPAWRTELAGYGGPLALSGAQLFAALGGPGAAGLALRGDPGAAVAALDAATGAVAWKLAVDATDWAVIAAITASPSPSPGSASSVSGGALIGGSFAGTLRIADRVVSSAGQADGFVARLTAAGGVAWLVRAGGPGADAIHGIAVAGDRIAIAGTFATGADLLGEPLPAFDDRSVAADGFVAELDAAGARRWVQTFGGPADDAVAGVAIDGRGQIVAAATARATVRIGATELTASGAADGLVGWWSADGTPLSAVLVGGSDFDGLRAIAPAGEGVVVAGFYSGSIHLGAQLLTAGGGDDAFVAALDASGAVTRAWPVGGDGREEVTQLAAIPGGFVAGVAHTAAARIGDAALPSPADPMSGAAIVVRPLR